MKINNGVYTALVTPFKSNGEVDYTSFEKLVDHQWTNGIRSFVVNGTTAESPTLSKEEVKNLFQVVRSYNKEAFITLGTGSNSTSATVEKTKWAEQLGCNAALVVVPYYNKPTQEGMSLHFTEVANSTQLPVIMYNVPGRTVVSMEAQTAIKLSELKNVVATKEASGDMSLMEDIRKGVHPDFKIFSGDDDSCLDLCSKDGNGVISVISHLIPKQMVEFVEEAMNKNESCKKKYQKYNELLKYLYIEPNPVPAKTALYLMGIIDSPTVRLPLCGMSENNRILLEQTMKELELL